MVILAWLTLVTGTFFYHWSECWETVDAHYFSVWTPTTIGYGDLLPTSAAAKLFTVMYSLIGIGIIAAFITPLALSIRDHHGRRRGRERDGGSQPNELQPELAKPFSPQDRLPFSRLRTAPTWLDSTCRHGVPRGAEPTRATCARRPWVLPDGSMGRH